MTQKSPTPDPAPRLSPAHTGRLPTAPVVTILLVVTFAVFSPALRGEFVTWDDPVYVVENPNIQTFDLRMIGTILSRSYFRNYAPVTLFSHAVDFALWGARPWGHHLTSVLIHCVNTGWVFLLSVMLMVIAREPSPRVVDRPAHWFRERLTTPIIAGGAAAALLFALHPLRVESVAWVSDRKDLLCGMFILPSTMAYIVFALRRGEPFSLRWYALSLALFVLALLSKPVAVVGPAVFLALDLLLLGRPEDRRLWGVRVLEKMPFLFLSLSVGVLTVALGGPGQPAFAIKGLSVLQLILLPFYSVSFYLWQWAWPAALLPLYSAPGVLLMAVGAFAVLSITAGAVRAAVHGRTVWLLCWIAYLLFIGPTLIGLGAGIQPWADRYSYLATVSFAILFGALLHRVLERAPASPGNAVLRAGPYAVSLIILAVCGVLTIGQMRIWRNSESLWSSAVAGTPDQPTPYNSLGAVFLDKGDLHRAEELFARSISIDPSAYRAYANLGMLYGAKGDTVRAVQSFLASRRLRPDYADAYTGLGSLYLQAGRFREAIGEYAAALDANPGLARASYNIGVAYYRLGIRDSALAMFELTTRLHPAFLPAYLNAGALDLERGEDALAIEMFTKAARLGSPEARTYLAGRGVPW